MDEVVGEGWGKEISYLLTLAIVEGWYNASERLATEMYGRDGYRGQSAPQRELTLIRASQTIMLGLMKVYCGTVLFSIWYNLQNKFGQATFLLL